MILRIFLTQMWFNVNRNTNFINHNPLFHFHHFQNNEVPKVQRIEGFDGFLSRPTLVWHTQAKAWTPAKIFI